MAIGRLVRPSLQSDGQVPRRHDHETRSLIAAHGALAQIQSLLPRSGTERLPGLTHLSLVPSLAADGVTSDLAHHWPVRNQVGH